jgi:hypothetical protein
MGFLMGVSSAYGAAVYWENESSIFEDKACWSNAQGEITIINTRQNNTVVVNLLISLSKL